MNDFISSKKCLTIGAFSKLSGINRKNLIYYDNVGILKPVFVKKNGYRYYSYSQLDEVSIILALKDLDIPLKKIKNYMENVSPHNLINLITDQKQKILEELNRLNQMNYIIEQRTSNIPVISNISCDKIFLENCKQELLFLGPEMKFDIDNFEEDFISFIDYSKSKKLVYGYPLGVYLNYDGAIEDSIKTYRYFYKVSQNVNVEKIIKPAGLYVITYDNSYLAEDMKNFDKLNEFIENNHLNICGNVYIENMSDEIITKNPNKYYSKISVKVKKLDDRVTLSY
ncbi:MerR family transcriptional regulator [Clostridium autoethanogenum]|uniref:MerR family transcriptional regulator n=1 Tax=Clostridium autoethanogenum DSM 10061 TaxID=1341692 RepID=A0ABN4BC06_9CLOT|nr:MerR family transcriptional regulator [Clostridium autoethanogenum]AGY74927.1 MerR family transcriptional regulator [Clostridium autoethanogenum DSM 10061]ALU35101.1 Transcriptional regulator MerR family [Clostridium autoethanogenum DSM 10061]OVY49399.1 Multidrug-efflux transporter 1 regulator [Clostridium autoethanogenum]